IVLMTPFSSLMVVPEPNDDDSERHNMADTHSSPTAATEDPTEPTRTSGSEGNLKSEMGTEGVNQRPQQPTGPDLSTEILNSPGLDLALMQERVLGHLGLSLAQAAAANAEASRQFPGSDMGVFAPFDMTAPPPPAPPANQRQPHGATTTNEPMGCNFCGRIFHSQASLEVHQRVHTGQRPFSCPHCGKSFAQPNNLRVHLLIHSGERRYRCSICGKSFISSSHLKRHRTVHTQEKPYICSRCGQSFTQLCSVRRHRQQSRCGEPPHAQNELSGFSQVGNRNMHLKFHAGEKPFVSTLCGRKFMTLSHMNIHGKGKPVKCCKCRKWFLDIDSCQKHQVARRGTV
uniref:C2H2-type domain-containing protein n=1 Tax=Oncorhynchus mykiss TaxID=8022 RepID=A0A8K9XNY2_ONCMY